MGTYSQNIQRKIAITLVKDKKHPALSKFVDNRMSFWFAYGDKKLHFGRGYLEGTLTLNKKGLSFYKNRVAWS